MLEKFFQENPKAALGFSGGVDSAYLLYEGLRCGADVRPYYIKTPFQPEFEYEDAMRLAKKLGAEVTVLSYDPLGCADLVDNRKDRCYHCKKMLFGRLQGQAEKDGYKLLLDGTNASDDAADRPGMKALTELSVRSPLREAGLTKPEIRRLSRQAGLFTWNKPAYACLATRIPQNMAITKELLQKVEQAEKEMKKLGFSDFRVRVCHDGAKLQVRQEQMKLALEKREEILCRIRPYFDQILLDMKARQ